MLLLSAAAVEPSPCDELSAVPPQPTRVVANKTAVNKPETNYARSPGFLFFRSRSPIGLLIISVS